MKEFAFIYRNSSNPNFKPSPEQMQEVLTSWMNWMGSLAAQNKIVSNGSRLSMSNAKTVRPNNVITDGPFMEIKEYINGFTLVRAASIEEAAELAKGCPILQGGGNVEVRAVVSADDNS